MNKEILVDANAFNTRVAVVEDGTPVELYVEQEGSERLVGNIYLGKVQNVLPGMQAAFVDIGLEKNAFLYAGDVFTPGDAYDELEKIPETRKISELLKPGQSVVVQVAKDPIGTKGARVTTHLTLAGRSLVLMPTVEYVGVSRRIEKEDERQRLRKLIKELKPEGMGVIVRTASAGRTKEAFSEELESLKLLYADIQKKAKSMRAPKLLHEEQSLLFRTVRDLLMRDVDRLFVNDRDAYNELCSIASVMAPKLRARILFKDSEALFERCEAESKIDKALARKVWLKSGGYLIIDRAEALTVIDVNTGKFVGKDNLEKTITATNCEAATEIALQLRLRDIGGIVIIDFIDMDDSAHRLQLYKYMQELMQGDRAKHTILPLTKFGLMQITRQRVRPATEINTTEVCPTCNGTGKVGPTILFDEAVERQLAFYVKEKHLDSFLLKVSPIFEAYLTRGFNSIRRKWCRKYDCRIKIVGDTDCSLLQATWCHADGESIA